MLHDKRIRLALLTCGLKLFHLLHQLGIHARKVLLVKRLNFGRRIHHGGLHCLQPVFQRTKYGTGILCHLGQYLNIRRAAREIVGTANGCGRLPCSGFIPPRHLLQTIGRRSDTIGHVIGVRTGGPQLLAQFGQLAFFIFRIRAHLIERHARSACGNSNAGWACQGIFQHGQACAITATTTCDCKGIRRFIKQRLQWIAACQHHIKELMGIIHNFRDLVGFQLAGFGGFLLRIVQIGLRFSRFQQGVPLRLKRLNLVFGVLHNALLDLRIQLVVRNGGGLRHNIVIPILCGHKLQHDLGQLAGCTPCP
ncbi:hypothetical protein SRCM100623_02313 [Acetobacter pasteurianus]|uniref:Uncharacterized protein n=1 Tax=Acetobacter pasteurianus TaxID=438 RepID=A0A1A0D351_ACEPA|nr:hypothetical protein SRCM100623_02313 [Acetobacter pasteurianus]